MKINDEINIMRVENGYVLEYKIDSPYKRYKIIVNSTKELFDILENDFQIKKIGASILRMPKKRVY